MNGVLYAEKQPVTLSWFLTDESRPMFQTDVFIGPARGGCARVVSRIVVWEEAGVWGSSAHRRSLRWRGERRGGSSTICDLVVSSVILFEKHNIFVRRNGCEESISVRDELATNTGLLRQFEDVCRVHAAQPVSRSVAVSASSPFCVTHTFFIKSYQNEKSFRHVYDTQIFILKVDQPVPKPEGHHELPLVRQQRRS